MEYYIPTIAVGILMLVLLFTLLAVEGKRRHRYYQACYHTSFVALDENRAKDLFRSNYIIGRRTRRCDIHLSDPSISRVHAVLWHDGQNFCIAPICDMEISRKAAKKALPKVYVNGDEVPESGVVLEYGDIIRMGDSRFTLQDTWGRFQYER